MEGGGGREHMSTRSCLERSQTFGLCLYCLLRLAVAFQTGSQAEAFHFIHCQIFLTRETRDWTWNILSLNHSLSPVWGKSRERWLSRDVSSQRKKAGATEGISSSFSGGPTCNIHFKNQAGLPAYYKSYLLLILLEAYLPVSSSQLTWKASLSI